MMKIVYIGGELPDKDASALRIMSNAKALREFGFEVVLVGENSDLIEMKEDFIDGFHSYILPSPKSTRSWLKNYISINYIINIFKREAGIDAIICYNFHAIPLFKLISFGKRNHIAIIADCTEWHTVSHLHGIKKIVKWTDIQTRIRIAQFHVDGIIAISQYFMNFYKKTMRVIVVPPLVDKSERKWNQLDDSVADDTRRFVYAGKVGIGKDQLTDCIEAFYKIDMKNYFVDIVGITKEDYLKVNPEHSKILEELATQVHFHGRVAHEEAVTFVKNADFSLLIRAHNRKNDSGFPTKLPESITCGTPVIATDFSDIRKYIEESRLGIIINDTMNVQEAVMRALEMTDDELNILKQNCRNSSTFDYHSYVNLLGNFVENVVRGKI